ncbi:helix-turn-helix transcriptional regulator [Agrococcus citreus]
MEVESRIGSTMAGLRRRADLSQPQLAALAGVPVSTVIGVELGAIEPPATLVARLAAAIASRLRERHE